MSKLFVVFMLSVISYAANSEAERPEIKKWIGGESAMLNTGISGSYKYLLIERNDHSTKALEREAMVVDCSLLWGDARLYSNIAKAMAASAPLMSYPDDSIRTLYAQASDRRSRKDFCNYIKDLMVHLGGTYSSLVLEIKDGWAITNAYGER